MPEFKLENQRASPSLNLTMSLEADLLVVCKYHGYKTCNKASTDLTQLGTLCKTCAGRIVAMLTSHDGTVTTNNAVEFKTANAKYPVSIFICVTEGDYVDRFEKGQ